ncbi:hypothetical protein GCM10010486_55510 [Nonomuraea roseoviolacea subsp. carminata]
MGGAGERGSVEERVVAGEVVDDGVGAGRLLGDAVGTLRGRHGDAVGAPGGAGGRGDLLDDGVGRGMSCG